MGSQRVGHEWATFTFFHTFSSIYCLQIFLMMTIVTNKGPSSQSYGFSSSHVWIWELHYKESCTPKNWCFRTMVLERFWRGFLRVTWTARLNQSILREISPEYSFEELMLKLKLQYSGHWCKELTHWKRPWGWERLKVGGEGDKRGWDGWMASPTRWTWIWANSRRWERTGNPGELQSMGLQKVGHNLVTEQQTVMTIMDGDAVSSAKIGKKQIENWALRWLIHHNIFPHCLLCFWIF